MRTEARPHGRFSPVLAYASAPRLLFSLAHSIAPKPPLAFFACRLAQYHDLKAISDLDLEGSNFAYQVDMALGMNTRELKTSPSIVPSKKVGWLRRLLPRRFR
jgi:hypothetical protein